MFVMQTVWKSWCQCPPSASWSLGWQFDHYYYCYYYCCYYCIDICLPCRQHGRAGASAPLQHHGAPEHLLNWATQTKWCKPLSQTLHLLSLMLLPLIISFVPLCVQCYEGPTQMGNPDNIVQACAAHLMFIFFHVCTRFHVT